LLVRRESPPVVSNAFPKAPSNASFALLARAQPNRTDAVYTVSVMFGDEWPSCRDTTHDIQALRDQQRRERVSEVVEAEATRSASCASVTALSSPRRTTLR
jgi:hypothetical protein